MKRILKEKLDNEIPIIAVVSVMGTTEESAVDPLTEILELRQKFRTKVRLLRNNFAGCNAKLRIIIIKISKSIQKILDVPFWSSMYTCSGT